MRGLRQLVEWNPSVRIAVDILFDGFNSCPQYLAVLLAVCNSYFLCLACPCWFHYVHYWNPGFALHYSNSVSLPFSFPIVFSFYNILHPFSSRNFISISICFFFPISVCFNSTLNILLVHLWFFWVLSYESGIFRWHPQTFESLS